MIKKQLIESFRMKKILSEKTYVRHSELMIKVEICKNLFPFQNEKSSYDIVAVVKASKCANVGKIKEKKKKTQKTC
ncbi:MAG: hypothetical protein HYT10_01995 [Candidatus Levybacteria bacterium]|nr:hypothetical protein [Candidatus Levybacteria bacterium]